MASASSRPAGRPESFRIDPAIDREALRAAYRRDRRVRIGPLLGQDAAAALLSSLKARSDWRLVVNSGEKVFELDADAQAAMDETGRGALDRAVWKGAREGFQYRFESVRVPDDPAERARRDDPVVRFAEFLSGGEALGLLRYVTGKEDIAFADAQATAYSPGHFLTEHDDAVPGKNRRAAYVYSLSPFWRPEWGGLLLFHDRGGLVAFPPLFDTLTLFAVPQPHSVSLVSPAAPRRRYSVTGWLRHL